VFRGIVVTPDTASAGEVLVEGNRITCVAPSCSSETGALGATVIDTHGMIFPGWSTRTITFCTTYSMRRLEDDALLSERRWVEGEPEYDAMQACYNYLLATAASGGADVRCEVNKYGELKD